MRRCLFFEAGQVLEVFFEVLLGHLLVLCRHFLYLKETVDAVVDHGELVQFILFQFLPDFGEVEYHLTPGNNLAAGHVAYECACGLRADHGRYYLGVQRAQFAGLLENIRDAFPATTVRRLVQSGVFAFPGIRIFVQPDLVLLDEVDDTTIDISLAGPEQPLLHRRTEINDMETADQCRIEVRQLVLVTGIHRTDDTAALRELAPRKLAVKRQVHNGLKDLRTGAVQFVEEKNDRLPVQGEPVGGHEVRLAGLFVLVGDSNQVTRVAHLAQEEHHDGHAFLGVIVSQDFGFADTVLADQHQIVIGRNHVEELNQLGCIYVDVRHSNYIYGVNGGFFQYKNKKPPGPCWPGGLSREMPLCGDAVFGEESPAQRFLESLAGPEEKGSGSVGRAADELSHMPRFHSVQLEGKNETMILVQRIYGTLDSFQSFA